MISRQNEKLFPMLSKRNIVFVAYSLSAWLLKKEPWIVPIPGTRKQQRLIDNAQAADIELTDKDKDDIDSLLEKVDYEQFEK